jgi:hypothetical protein
MLHASTTTRQTDSQQAIGLMDGWVNDGEEADARGRWC